MNKRKLVHISFGLALAAASLVVVQARVGDATAAPPSAKSDKSAAPAPSAAKTDKGAASAPSALPAGTNSTDVYGKLTQEIEGLSKQVMSASSPDEQVRLFGQIEGKLVAFRAKYPNTPESTDAAFQLGALNFGEQKYEESSKYLNEYLGKVATSDREKAAFAHFYLAESYKALGKYDLTEAEYKLVLDKYSNVNSQLTDAVKGGLDGLAIERKLAIGGAPLDFSVKSIDGQTLSPAAYKGKVLLIDFWATWCGPCVAEMPNVKQVYAKFHPQGFEIVGVSLDQSRDRLDQFLKSNQIVWPQYFDGKWWNNDVAVRYGIKSIPTTILVDKSGKIRYKSLRGKQLESAVQQLVTEKL